MTIKTTISDNILVNSPCILNDAPVDGNVYLRKNQSFVKLDIPVDGLKEAPRDGHTYCRQNGAWLDIDISADVPPMDSSKKCIGVAKLADGGGSGVWNWIDYNIGSFPDPQDPSTTRTVGYGNFVRPSIDYFDNHPIYSNIKEVEIDGQVMIRIPKFYYKNVEHHEIWISPDQEDSTFKVHPAFMVSGSPVDCFYFSKYNGSLDSSNKMESLPNRTVVGGLSKANAKTYIEKRNTGGVSGFCMPNIYMWSAIQTLFLIEYASTNARAAFSNDSPVAPGGSTSNPISMKNTYRGMSGLFSQISIHLDGYKQATGGAFSVWDNLGNKTYVSAGTFPSTYSTTMGSGYGYAKKMMTQKDDTRNYDMCDLYFWKELTATYSDGTYSDIQTAPYNVAKNELMVGGNISMSGFGGISVQPNGLFFLRIYDSAATGSSNTGVGSRLAFI